MDPQEPQQTETPASPPEETKPEATQTEPAPQPVEQPGQPNQPAQKTKGYGKRPVWQWVLIYVVVAIVVYGLIYILFIHHKSSTGTSTGY